MRRQAVPVGAPDELERLALEHRWAGVGRQPRVGQYHELHTDQLQTASRRFVDQRFGTRGIQYSVADQGTIDIVKAHCAVIRAADTAQERLISGGSGCVHVDELLRSVANDLNEFGRGALAIAM